MTQVPIYNVGALGIIRDLKPHLLPPEAWSEGRNVRFTNLRAEKVRGHESIFIGNTIAPRWALPWVESGTRYWIYTDGTSLWRTDGVIHTDITRAVGGAYNGGSTSKWSGGVLGGIPIVTNNSAQDVPQQWNSGTGLFIDLTNWPASTYANILRVFRQFLVAYGITSGGTLDPFLVKWSQPAAPGAVPSTWDPTDTSALAGEWPLVETDGIIIDALELGGTNFIYKSDSVVRMDFIGTNDVFSFRTFSKDGILAQDCVKEFDGGHCFLTRNDLKVHNGASKPISVLDKKNRKWLFNTISQTYKDRTFMVSDPGNKTIMVFYVPEGSLETYPTEIFLWNWSDGSCGHKDVPTIQYSASGQVNTSGVSNVIDNQTQIIDDDTSLIDEGIDRSVDQVLMLRPDTREFLLNDVGNKNQRLGSDLVTNGDFSSGVGWTLGPGWTIAAGVASSDGTQTANSALERAPTSALLPDTSYRIIFTVSNYSAGNIRGRVDDNLGTERTANGTYSEIITTTNEITDNLIGVTASSEFVGDIDDLEVRELLNSDYLSYVERIESAIAGVDRAGVPKVDPTNRKFVNSVHWLVESTGSVEVRVGRHNRVGGPVRWSSLRSFDPATDLKRNFRVQGKALAFRLQTPDTSGVMWSLSGYLPDVQIVSRKTTR